MISSLGAQWTSADLTGNGQLFDLGGGEIYVVSNGLTDGTFKILYSADNGATFDVVASHTFTNPPAQFDPAVTQWGTFLHILGTQGNATDSSLVDLVTFTFDLGLQTLSAPNVILTGTRVHSGYDVILLDDQTHVFVTAVTDLVDPPTPGYALVAGVIDINDALDTLEVLEASSVRDGDAHGGISLVSNGTTVELFYTTHPKRSSLGTVQQKIETRVRDAMGVWGAASTVFEYVGRYLDDKLTVLQLNNSRLVLSHLYYQQHKSKISSVMVLGVRDTGVWSFMSYTGREDVTYLEPTLSVDTDQNVRIAYLVGDANLMEGGWFRVSDLNLTTLKYTPRRGHYNQLFFRWLRGSKGYVDSLTSKWEVVGEQTVKVGEVITGYEPIYVSEFNLPPVVSLVIREGQTVIDPPIGNIIRGIPVRLDASATRDPDFDTMTFTWSLIGAPVGVELIAVPGHTDQIDVVAPRSVGPTEQTFTVRVSVQDKDILGANINSPVTADATLTIPLNAAPTITWSPVSPWSVPRNSYIVLQPTISDTDVDPLTFSWTQTAGPTLRIIEDTTSSYLAVDTAGVNVLGDTATFQLTVSDGINTPVSSSITLNIASINLDNLDQNFVSRNIFTTTGGLSPIGNRNNPLALSSWKTVLIGAVSSDFFKVRYSRVAESGHVRSVYISQRTVTVLGPEGEGAYYYRKVFLPGNDRGHILDAFYTEAEQILVYTDSNHLLRYTPDDIGVMNLKDIGDIGADLVPYLRGGRVKWFTCSVPYNGHRVLAFVTDKGLLLAQINEDTFHLEGVQFLSTYDFNLYGGDDVLFVRFRGVENLRKGQVLIGTQAPKSDILLRSDFEYFETVFDLNLKAVLNVWDRTNRINETVVTGEMLDSVSAEYTGILQAPVLHLEELAPDTIRLFWDQVRPDLVAQYDIFGNVSAGLQGSKFGYTPVDPSTPFVCPDEIDSRVYQQFTATLPVVDPVPTYSWKAVGGTIQGPSTGNEVTIVPGADMDAVQVSCSIMTVFGQHYNVGKTVLVRPGDTMVTDWKMTLVAGKIGQGASTNGPLGDNQLEAPGAAVLGNDGFLYISENWCIKKLNLVTSDLSNYFEPGGYGQTPLFRNGPVAQAKISAYGHGMTKAANGDIYFTDSSSSIRKISNGVVSTFAGPDFFVADSVFGVSVTLQDINTEAQTVVAWPGPDILIHTDGTGTAARFKDPQGLAFDLQGNLWVADDSCVRMITPAGVVTTPYGKPGETINATTGHRDGTGNSGSYGTARFQRTQGIAIAVDGTVFVSDYDGLRQLKNGVATTIVPTGHPPTDISQWVLLDGLGGTTCSASTPAAPAVADTATPATSRWPDTVYYYGLTVEDHFGVETAASPIVVSLGAEVGGSGHGATTLITFPAMPANGVGFRLYQLSSSFHTDKRSLLIPSTTASVEVTYETQETLWDYGYHYLPAFSLPGTPHGSAFSSAPVGPWVRGSEVLFVDAGYLRSYSLASKGVTTIMGSATRDNSYNGGQGIGTRTSLNTPFYLTPGSDNNTLFLDDWWGEVVYRLNYGTWPIPINPTQTAPWNISLGETVRCYIKATDPLWETDPGRVYKLSLTAGTEYRIEVAAEDAIWYLLYVVDPLGITLTFNEELDYRIGNGRMSTTYKVVPTTTGIHKLYVTSSGGEEGTFNLSIVVN